MLNNLLNVMDVLMGENGCPWDKVQTHESLRENMIEEANEAVEAINSGDMAALREELGDVLLQVIFHAKIAEKAGAFTMDDIMATLHDKLIRRHSHIFGSDKALTEEEALEIWNKNKKLEKK